MRVGQISGWDQRDGLGGLLTPSVVPCAGIMYSYPTFAPGSSEMAVGILAILYLFIHNLPQLCRHAVIFSPL